MRKCLLIVALVGVIFGFGPVAHAQQAQTACPAPGAFMDAKAQTVQEALFSLEPVAPQEAQQCTMCNLTGYQSCDSLNGQSCPVSGEIGRAHV